MNRKNAEIRDPKVGNNPGTLKLKLWKSRGRDPDLKFEGPGSRFRIAKRVKSPGSKYGVLQLCRGNYLIDISGDLLSSDDSEIYIVNKFAIKRKHVPAVL